MLVVGLIFIVIGAFLPFFTLGEDSKMYRDVAMQFVLLFPLVIMLFSAGRSWTRKLKTAPCSRLSKPIFRWQVVVGKYLGVICLVLVAVVVLGLFSANFAY